MRLNLLVDFGGREPAPRRAAVVVGLDDAQTAVERLLGGLDDRHRDSGVHEVHRDPTAHGAGTDQHEP